MTEPRRDHYLAPATGADTRQALDAAIAHLAALRHWTGPTDATVTLHLLASLQAETHKRLADLVTKARTQGCSWAQIADLLGVTRASAWQRFGQHTPNPNHTSEVMPIDRPKAR
jgi:hypothetical protein